MNPLKKAAEIVKLFGMSNLLLEEGLDRVEAELEIDLGRTQARVADKDRSSYPQFEAKIRTEAARMAEVYEVFYCLERSIRVLISDALTTDAGAKWWDTEVPDKIRADVMDRIQREKDSGVTLRSTDPLDFTNFGELNDIIQKNWDVFGQVFSSRKAVEKVISSLNTLRAPVAHSVALAEDEVLRLHLNFRDWFRLMGS